MYIEAQKQFRNLNNVEDSLIYYLELLLKNEDEKCDFEFIDKLFEEGIDIDYRDEDRENALFKVNKTIHINSFSECEI